MMKLDLSGLEQFRASSLLAMPSAGGPVPAVDVALDMIDFDPAQPRRAIDAQQLEELAASIQAVGVLEPVTLRSDIDRPGRFIVSRGERRVRASRLAGRTAVPAVIDERTDVYCQVIENLHREDLSPFDLAAFIAQREQLGESRAHIARRLHKPRSYVTELAALIDAPEVVRGAYERGETRDRQALYRMALAVRGVAHAPCDGDGDGDAAGRQTDATQALAPVAIGQVHRLSNREPGETAARRPPRASRMAHALRVEHAGRIGRVRWSRPPGDRSADVEFDDGSRRVVGLDELKLVEWTGR